MACRNFSSRSATSALIWMTKENNNAEKKKSGPMVPTVEKVSSGGCGNSLKSTCQSKPDMELFFARKRVISLWTAFCVGRMMAWFGSVKKPRTALTVELI